MPHKLVAVTTQAWESTYPLYTVRWLIELANKKHSQLILCVDSKKFQTWKGHRPVIEQEYVKEPIYDYVALYADLKRVFDENGLAFPLRDTLNVFLQVCAATLRSIRKVECRSTPELLESCLSAPENPIWYYWEALFLTGEGPRIPSSVGALRELSNTVRRRFEVNTRDLSHFIHDLRGGSEKFLDRNMREEAIASDNNLAQSSTEDFLKSLKEPIRSLISRYLDV